jgi:carbonic anhydrase
MAPVPEWSYDGELGPKHWGELHPDFAACSAGRLQSPIDLRDAREVDAEPIRPLYRPGPLRVSHDGHLVRVHPGEPQELQIGAERFTLLELHFHTPSEHALAGSPYAAEGHFVHRAEDGELAVLGVLVEPGEASAALARLEPLPAPGEEERTVDAVDLRELLPARLTAYRYTGSLTTPPCSEGIRWSVAAAPIALSDEQLDRLRSAQGHSARPLQPRNDRELTLG